MEKIKLDVLIYEESGNWSSWPQAITSDNSNLCIRLFCALNSPKSEKTNALCSSLKEQGKITEYELFSCHGKNFMQLSNELFLTPDEGYILFLSASIAPACGMIYQLVKKLASSNDLCGVNPVLTADWISNKICAFLGVVCDFQHQMHYLYEGISTDNPLAQKERFFQFAHPSALLIRKKDFYAAGGFNTKLDYLAFYEFCIRLANSGKQFTVLPDCKAGLLDRFDSWKFCGTWNSAIQSGRLLTESIKPSYPELAIKDNINWQLDPWLNEYADISWESSASPEYKAWLQWRHHPNPVTLLQYIVQLPAKFQKDTVELARLLPASLPKVLQYYSVHAALLKNTAANAGFMEMAAAAEKWIKGKGSFERYILKPCITLLQKQGIYNCSLATSTAVFNAWVETGEKVPTMQIGDQWPEIAIVMPVYNPEPEFLRQAINSVKRQRYPKWQLCIADDASTNPEIISLLRSYIDTDSRIKIVFRNKNGHICKATNSALELVNAPFTGFLDNDDLLAPEAIGMVARQIVDKPSSGFIFSDEDHVTANNIRTSPIFKEDFNRDQFFTGHLSVYNTDLIRQVGGLRPGFEGSQDFDLALRISEKLDKHQIVHIPHILYHWRIHDKSTASVIGAKPYVLKATAAAWLASVERKREQATIAATDKNNFYNLAYQLKNILACSVIFFTDANAPFPSHELLVKLARAFQGKTEFLIQPLEKLKNTGLHNLPTFANFNMLPFCDENWASAANAAASKATGEVLLFLYAALESVRDWRPEQLVYHALRQDVGACGGLIWKNGYLVNGGWYPDVTGLPFILCRDTPQYRLKDVSWGQFLLTRHVLGVSWQCACLRKEYLNEYGPFRESLGSLAFLDYCLSQIKHGKNIIATPFAQWENGKDEKITPEELNRIFAVYGSIIKSSGLRNANLRAAPDHGWTLIF